MVDHKEILRLYDLGFSQRQIASSIGSSRTTVKETIVAAQTAGLHWPFDEKTTNQDLENLLFPNLYQRTKSRKEPDYTYIHKELAKPGVTLTLLWSEYCQDCRISNEIPFMHTQFNEKYRRWAQITKATMRISHKPGEAMQVDWAGNTIPVYDSVTGESSPAYLFVGVLPCSCFVYVEACSDMRSENWLACHVHAFNYFQGVPRLLIPDNLKTGVSKNTRYETILNRSYQELAEHYDTAIVPARVKHPQDKSLAEGSVKNISIWIIAALRNQKFFSIEDVNQSVRVKLEELNNRPFKKREGSRHSAYLNEEKEFMKPLPLSDYEPSVWSTAKIGRDYLITDGLNKYSVPFDLIGEQVDIRLTPNIIEVFHKGSRITSHLRFRTAQRSPIIRQEHMTPEHRQYLNYNSESFKEWAFSVGPQTEAVINAFLSSGKEPEQAYKACASLMRLEKKYGSRKLEAASGQLLSFSDSPSVRNISAILKSSLSQNARDKDVSSRIEDSRFGITRGAAYYSRKKSSNDD